TYSFAGYAIHCYQCESITSPKCGLKFEADPSLLFDCARVAPPRYTQNFYRNATGCLKRTIDGVTGPTIERRCYFGDVNNIAEGCRTDFSDSGLPNLKQLSCDVCTKDECNGSASLAPIAGAILLFFGVARILA
ncbi:hypothetical protein KR222_008285, partial [Zaprionus bogoriensis]